MWSTLITAQKGRKVMTEAYKLAGKKSSEADTRAKQRYDCFVRSSILLLGDGVLVRSLSEQGGPGKLRSHWEDQIHIVVSPKGEDSPLYEVKPEAGTGGNRTLHRNLPLPCKNLPMNIPNKTSQKREIRVRKDKCSTAYQIPVPQAVDVSDETCNNVYDHPKELRSLPNFQLKRNSLNRHSQRMQYRAAPIKGK